MDTEKNNRLISEFMNDQEPNFDGRVCYGNYHNSWDWLMPVVQKIESPVLYDKGDADFVVNVLIMYDHCWIKDEDGAGIVDIFVNKESTEQKISATYEAVVKYIQWHNLQELNPKD